MDYAFWFNVIILVVVSVIVGLCGYITGHVHGFEKGESQIDAVKFDELVYEYCPRCKRINKDDEILSAEVLNEF